AVREWMPRGLFGRGVRLIGLATVAVAAFGYGVYNVRGYHSQWWSSIPRKGTENIWPLVVWTQSHTAPNAVVASNAEPLLYLYTGRPTLPATTFTVDEYFHPRAVAANM